MQVRFNVPEKFFLKGIPCRVDLSAGQQVGPYLVGELLGSGTFGIVYQVKKNGIPYALKLLKLWEVVYKNQKETIGERFLYEFHAASTRSDYLVHSHEFGEIDNNPFFIMDYIRNGDVRGKIGSLSQQEIISIGYDTLKGLRDLHNAGIIHRDIKPDNVLLTDGGKALLTDFGISAFVNHQIKRKTAPNLFGKVKETFGTYAYIPPEQLVDRMKFYTTTARTDIWAWGVMLYELFSDGEYPWGSLSTESDLVEFIRNAQTGKMVHTKGFSKMPDNWAKAVEGCLQSSFEQRTESIDDILNTLGKLTSTGKRGVIAADRTLVLHIMKGVEIGRKYLLPPQAGISHIGRGESNHVVLLDFQTNYISRRHCTIECVPSLGGWYVRDGQWISGGVGWLTSTNGTYLNVNRLGKDGTKLKSGDIMTVGDTTIRIEQGMDANETQRNLY